MATATREKIQEIAERLAKLSPEAQAEEIAKIEKNVTKRETKAQKSVLSEHKEKIASAFVDTILQYAANAKIEPSVLVPLTVKIAASEDGQGFVGAVTGKGAGGKGGGGSRGESFLKANNVVAIELHGKPLEKTAESEVLRVAHGVEVAKDVYGTKSPHVVAMQPENLKLIKDKGFVAVLENGQKVPLVSLYEKKS
ncbi:hypothetical protein LCGC14_0442630 [marine sediment metagenome]|uniref:Uncharacterized protein n=1 Tax=marine sediment metagenome TaxID=412755 RepID=A0A0F9VU70_9ZZZZ